MTLGIAWTRAVASASTNASRPMSAPRVSTLGADGRAPLELYADGAFTVGIVTESGTTLELNLATLGEAPDTFRTR